MNEEPLKKWVNDDNYKNIYAEDWESLIEVLQKLSANFKIQLSEMLVLIVRYTVNSSYNNSEELSKLVAQFISCYSEKINSHNIIGFEFEGKVGLFMVINKHEKQVIKKQSPSAKIIIDVDGSSDFGLGSMFVDLSYWGMLSGLKKEA